MSLPPADDVVVEDASTSEPCEICSLQPQNPCDVDKLKLKVEGIDADGKPKIRELEIPTSHRRSESVRLWDRELRSLLRNDYDIVIDVIADVDAETFPSPRKPAKIDGAADYHVGQCSLQRHAELQLRPLGVAPELDGETEITRSQPGASSLTIPKTELFAPTTFIDHSGSSGDNPLDEAQNLFKLISLLWDVLAARVVELDAFSCGIRPAEDTAAANLNIRAAARIFRRSKFTLGIKIPALGGYTNTLAGTRGIDSSSRTHETAAHLGNLNRASSESTTRAGDDITSVGSNTVNGEETVHMLQGLRDDAGNFTTTGYGSASTSGQGTAMGVVTRADVEARLASAPGFDVVLKHNGQDVPGLDVIDKVKKVVNELFEAIKNLQDTINAAPQLGWKFTFEVSVLAGEIILEWFPEYIDQPEANGRYLPVQLKLTGKFELTIFEVTVSASFGIDASAAGTGVTVNITGSLSGKAGLSADFTLDLATPRQVFGVTAEAGAELKIVGRATVLGKTLADAELKGTGGIELVNG